MGAGSAGVHHPEAEDDARVRLVEVVRAVEEAVVEGTPSIGRRRFHGDVDLASTERRRNASKSRVEETVCIDIILSTVCCDKVMDGWMLTTS